MKGFCFAWMFFLFAHNIKLSVAEIRKDVDYDKHRHPLDVGRDHLDVNMSFDLSEIRDIDEVNGVMTIKLSYKRVWHDNRINFTNIKEGQSRILPDERNTIWLPWTIFDNLKHNNSMLKSDKLDSCLARQANNGSSKYSSESKMLIEYEKYKFHYILKVFKRVPFCLILILGLTFSARGLLLRFECPSRPRKRQLLIWPRPV